MNSFLQDNLVFILVIIIFAFMVMGALIVYLIFKLSKISPAKESVESDKVIFKKLTKGSVVEKYYCSKHPDRPTVGSCLLCEDVFCEDCLVEHEGMYFCKEHFKVYAAHKWTQITDVKTTPDEPEKGLFVYDFKRKIWKDKQTPTFVLTHYKINVEGDFIESYIQLNVREEDADQLRTEINKFQESN